MVVGVLLFSLVLLRLPTAFGTDAPPLVVLGSRAPLLMAIGALLLWKGTWQARAPHLWLFAAYGTLVGVSIFRAAAAGANYSFAAAVAEVLGWLFIGVLGLLSFVRERRVRERRKHLEALCWAPVVYIAVNVVLHALGVGSGRTPGSGLGGGYEATVLQTLGIPASRTLFPFAGGINSFGPISAVALTTSLMFVILARGRKRLLAGAGALVSVYALLAVDSRGALLFAIGAVLLLIVVPRSRTRGLAGLPLLLPLVPVLLLAVLASLADTQLAGSFAREGESLATGSDRSIIWGNTARFLLDFRFDHLLGYGAYGQLTSGVSATYASVFSTYDDPLLASAHNIVLQTVLDTGWLGLMVTVALFVTVLRCLGARYARDHGPVEGALLASACCVLLIGAVEAVPSHAVAPDAFAFWLLLVGAALYTGSVGSRTPMSASTGDEANLRSQIELARPVSRPLAATPPR